VAAGNDHDGISVENTASNIDVYNCILAHNAQDGTTLVMNERLADLWVGSSVSGFAANHNVMIAQSPHGTVWQDKLPRGLVYYGGTLYDTLRAGLGYLSASGQDGNSRNGEPLFVNEGGGNFIVGSTSSKALDRAKTDLTDWLGTDPRGFVAHNVCESVVPDSGAGSVLFADIGAYEYDPAPGNIADVRQGAPSGSHSVTLVWTATHEDGTVGCAVDSADVRYSVEPIVTEQAFQLADRVANVLVPANPGSQQTLQVTTPELESCTLYHFAVKVRADENGLWSSLLDTAMVETACSSGGCPNPPCEIDRPGFGAVVSKEEGTDFPLGLAGVHPNPNHGAGTVTWSIPQVQAGAPYDLSVFDVAGRKVATIASGAARPGRFAENLSFQAGNGVTLPNGLFFVRLRVGSQTLHSSVVVAR
jgi:hypothetical protein